MNIPLNFDGLSSSSSLLLTFISQVKIMKNGGMVDTTLRSYVLRVTNPYLGLGLNFSLPFKFGYYVIPNKILLLVNSCSCHTMVTLWRGEPQTPDSITYTDKDTISFRIMGANPFPYRECLLPKYNF